MPDKHDIPSSEEEKIQQCSEQLEPLLLSGEIESTIAVLNEIREMQTLDLDSKAFNPQDAAKNTAIWLWKNPNTVYSFCVRPFIPQPLGKAVDEIQKAMSWNYQYTYFRQLSARKKLSFLSTSVFNPKVFERMESLFLDGTGLLPEQIEYQQIKAGVNIFADTVEAGTSWKGLICSVYLPLYGVYVGCEAAYSAYRHLSVDMPGEAAANAVRNAQVFSQEGYYEYVPEKLIQIAEKTMWTEAFTVLTHQNEIRHLLAKSIQENTLISTDDLRAHLKRLNNAIKAHVDSRGTGRLIVEIDEVALKDWIRWHKAILYLQHQDIPKGLDYLQKIALGSSVYANLAAQQLANYHLGQGHLQRANDWMQIVLDFGDEKSRMQQALLDIITEQTPLVPELLKYIFPQPNRDKTGFFREPTLFSQSVLGVSTLLYVLARAQSYAVETLSAALLAYIAKQMAEDQTTGQKNYRDDYHQAAAMGFTQLIGNKKSDATDETIQQEIAALCEKIEKQCWYSGLPELFSDAPLDSLGHLIKEFYKHLNVVKRNWGKGKCTSGTRKLLQQRLMQLQGEVYQTLEAFLTEDLFFLSIDAFAQVSTANCTAYRKLPTYLRKIVPVRQTLIGDLITILACYPTTAANISLSGASWLWQQFLLPDPQQAITPVEIAEHLSRYLSQAVTAETIDEVLKGKMAEASSLPKMQRFILGISCVLLGLHADLDKDRIFKPPYIDQAILYFQVKPLMRLVCFAKARWFSGRLDYKDNLKALEDFHRLLDNYDFDQLTFQHQLMIQRELHALGHKATREAVCAILRARKKQATEDAALQDDIRLKLYGFDLPQGCYEFDKIREFLSCLQQVPIDSKQLKNLLSEGFDPDYPITEHVIAGKDEMALFWRQGEQEIITYPLHVAMQQLDVDAVTLLIHAGADLKKKDIFGLQPLQFLLRYHGAEAQEDAGVKEKILAILRVMTDANPLALKQYVGKDYLQRKPRLRSHLLPEFCQILDEKIQRLNPDIEISNEMQPLLEQLLNYDERDMFFVLQALNQPITDQRQETVSATLAKLVNLTQSGMDNTANLAFGMLAHLAYLTDDETHHDLGSHVEHCWRLALPAVTLKGLRAFSRSARAMAKITEPVVQLTALLEDFISGKKSRRTVQTYLEGPYQKQVAAIHQQAQADELPEPEQILSSYQNGLVTFLLLMSEQYPQEHRARYISLCQHYGYQPNFERFACQLLYGQITPENSRKLAGSLAGFDLPQAGALQYHALLKFAQHRGALAGLSQHNAHQQIYRWLCTVIENPQKEPASKSNVFSVKEDTAGQQQLLQALMRHPDNLAKKDEPSSENIKKMQGLDIKAALADGNCLYNSLSLSLAMQLKDHTLSLALVERMATQLDAAVPPEQKTAWTLINPCWEILTADINTSEKTQRLLAHFAQETDKNIQQQLSPLLRLLAVKFIRDHYQDIFHQGFEANLQELYRNRTAYTTQIDPNHFMYFPFIRTALQQHQTLSGFMTWWQNIGKTKYFDEIAQPARHASDGARWAADIELEALNQCLQINTRLYDARLPQQTYQQLGVGSGLVMRSIFTQAEIESLLQLEFVEPVGSQQLRLKSTALQQLANWSPQPEYRQYLEILWEQGYSQLPPYTAIQTIPALQDMTEHAYQQFQAVLEARGILKTAPSQHHHFITDDGETVAKERIRLRMAGIHANLKARLEPHCHHRCMSLGIVFYGNHYDAVQLPAERPAAASSSSQANMSRTRQTFWNKNAVPKKSCLRPKGASSRQAGLAVSFAANTSFFVEKNKELYRKPVDIDQHSCMQRYKKDYGMGSPVPKGYIDPDF